MGLLMEAEKNYELGQINVSVGKIAGYASVRTWV